MDISQFKSYFCQNIKIWDPYLFENLSPPPSCLAGFIIMTPSVSQECYLIPNWKYKLGTSSHKLFQLNEHIRNVGFICKMKFTTYHITSEILTCATGWPKNHSISEVWRTLSLPHYGIDPFHAPFSTFISNKLAWTLLWGKAVKSTVRLTSHKISSSCVYSSNKVLWLVAVWQVWVCDSHHIYGQ